VQIIVGGTDAQYYYYNALWNVLNTIVVLPPLAFSPIPATYIDGTAENLFVSLTSAFASGTFPYQNDRSFSIHITSQAPGSIYFEPDALNFSPTSTTTQSFRIVHMYPSGVHGVIGSTGPHGNAAGTDGYPLTWSLKWIGTPTLIPITRSIVPQDAQRVVVARYQIIPEFPRVLSYDWQDAAFNLTRPPIAHLSLHPHQPHRDGRPAPSYGSSKAAAGRIVTDPPVVVFNPGQRISRFRVRAIAGQNQDQALYYRVDWQLSGHQDDRVCYIESGDAEPQGAGPYTFSTYHVASASTITATVMAVAIAALLIL
jgi:hypothetical protein